MEGAARVQTPPYPGCLKHTLEYDYKFRTRVMHTYYRVFFTHIFCLSKSLFCVFTDHEVLSPRT